MRAAQWVTIYPALFYCSPLSCTSIGDEDHHLRAYLNQSVTPGDKQEILIFNGKEETWWIDEGGNKQLALETKETNPFVLSFIRLVQTLKTLLYGWNIKK